MHIVARSSNPGYNMHKKISPKSLFLNNLGEIS